MSRVCHECWMDVENPFYSISAVLRDSKNDRLAFSQLEVSLCKNNFEAIRCDILQNAKDMESDLGIAIDGVTGECGGSRGTVQLSSQVYERHLQYEFLDKDVAIDKLPSSARDLFKKPKWLELTEEGEWKEASWADELYKRLNLN